MGKKCGVARPVADGAASTMSGLVREAAAPAQGGEGDGKADVVVEIFIVRKQSEMVRRSRRGEHERMISQKW